MSKERHRLLITAWNEVSFATFEKISSFAFTEKVRRTKKTASESITAFPNSKDSKLTHPTEKSAQREKMD